MVVRKLSPKRSAPSAAKGTAVSASTPKSAYPTTAKRPARVADGALVAADHVVPLPEHYGEIAEERGSGVVRRKNLNIDQGLLDHARHVLGVRTETEAVELGLGAVIELVEFHRDMLNGFDRLMVSGGFTHDASEARDFSGFIASSGVR